MHRPPIASGGSYETDSIRRATRNPGKPAVNNPIQECTDTPQGRLYELKGHWQQGGVLRAVRACHSTQGALAPRGRVAEQGKDHFHGHQGAEGHLIVLAGIGADGCAGRRRIDAGRCKRGALTPDCPGERLLRVLRGALPGWGAGGCLPIMEEGAPGSLLPALTPA
jgi:hypothetical protein